jgi:DNA (cytosine-5)-methyltransferase 1
MSGRKLRVLDLFSGIGGFSLGLERTGGFETVAFCEIEEYPRRVLAKHWPGTPIHLDVRKLTGADIGPVDVICGGYPCQPFSTAGKRQGADDDRHLWPEFMRLVAELRPAWVIGENVAGHISMGLDDVLADLEAENYAARPFVIPACAVGASHRRDRVWTVAHPASEQDRRRQQRTLSTHAFAGSQDVAHAICHHAQGQQPGCADTQERAGSQQRPIGPRGDGGRGWRVESRMGRMADGFSCWLDEPGERVKAGVKDRAPRLKALGNAVHPDVAMMIGHAILQAEAAA